MFLEVKNPEKVEKIGEFFDYLIAEMTTYATDPLHQDKGQVDIWNSYFESTDLGWPVNDSGQPTAPTFQYIVYQWFSHLDWFETKGNYYIIPNEDLLLNSTEITIDSLAQMINYGVLGTPAYRYFEDVLNHFADNLTDLYIDWAGIEEEI